MGNLEFIFERFRRTGFGQDVQVVKTAEYYRRIQVSTPGTAGLTRAVKCVLNADVGEVGNADEQETYLVLCEFPALSTFRSARFLLRQCFVRTGMPLYKLSNSQLDFRGFC